MSFASRPSPPPLSDLTPKQVQWIGAGYLMAVGSMMGQTIFIAQFNTAIRDSFGLSHGQFGGLYTIATFMSSMVLIYAGGLADKYPPRRLAVISLLCLCAVAYLATSATHIIVLGLSLFGLRLFGQGMMSHLAMTTMSRWFSRFRGRALALAQLGMPTGDATVPFVMTGLILAFGWRQAWMLAILFWLLALLPLIFFLLRDPPDGKRARQEGYVNPDADHVSMELGAKWTRGAVVRDPLFWLIIPGLMGPPAIGTLYFFHQAHLVAIKGWDLTVFTALFPVLAVSGVITGIVAGNLIDRFGAFRLLPFVLIPEAIGCLFIGSVDALWLIPVFFVSFGMTGGLMSPTVGALWAELYGTKHIGAIRALASSAFVFASAVGPGLSGYLIDIGLELDRQAYIYAAFCIVASVGYAVTRSQFVARHEALIAERTALSA